MVAVLVAMPVALAPRARAESPEEDAAKQEYDLGWQALQDGKPAEALEHYRRSYDLLPRARTLFNIAVTEEKLGLLPDALVHYSEFLERAEARDLDLTKLAREKVAELEKRVPGTVEIVSTPAGADVYVDGAGTRSGRTPLTLELTAGSHRVKVVAHGAEPSERSVKVAAGKFAQERFALTVLPPPRKAAGPEASTRRRDTDADGRGALVIHSKVAGAAVSIDGMVVGTTRLGDHSNSRTPVLEHDVAHGQHTVIVERAGGRSWHKRLHVSPDEIVTIDLAFQGPRPARKRLLKWGLVGLSAVGLAAGGTLGVLALRDVTGATADEHSRGKTRARLSDLFMAGGAAALLGAWWIDRKPPTRVEIRRSHEDE